MSIDKMIMRWDEMRWSWDNHEMTLGRAVINTFTPEDMRSSKFEHDLIPSCSNSGLGKRSMPLTSLKLFFRRLRTTALPMLPKPITAIPSSCTLISVKTLMMYDLWGWRTRFEGMYSQQIFKIYWIIEEEDVIISSRPYTKLTWWCNNNAIHNVKVVWIS